MTSDTIIEICVNYINFRIEEKEPWINKTEALWFSLRIKGRKSHLVDAVMSHYHMVHNDIDGLVQDCSNSSALAVELLQFCTKP